jgi:hypothetical protein
LIETSLVKNCIEGDRQAQSNLYAMFASVMFVVSLRYSKKQGRGGRGAARGIFEGISITPSIQG